MTMRMETKLRDVCIFFVFGTFLACSMQGESQSGFVSLDCGGTGSYSDVNNITWTSDNEFGSVAFSGNTTTITPPLSASNFYKTPLSTMRYFPGDRSKYCYTFSKEHGVKNGSAYLVRASFWTGSFLPYATRSIQEVKFALLIFADIWDEVVIPVPQKDRETTKEIFIIAEWDHIDVCLAGRSPSSDIPFISSLELRPLSTDMLSVQYMMLLGGRQPMLTAKRLNFGELSGKYIRYGDDVYDRIWEPDMNGPILATTLDVDNYNGEMIPVPVLQTAQVDNDIIDRTIIVSPNKLYYIQFAFAEISPNVTSIGQRAFDLQISTGKTIVLDTPYDVYMDAGNLTYSALVSSLLEPINVGSGGSIELTLKKQVGSTYGPLISGLELFQLFGGNLSMGTDDAEVSMLREIISAFPSLDSWTGDPCLPYPYNWLTCNNVSRPNIYTISLENHNLHGVIPNQFNSFKLLTELSLAENMLNGSIPKLDELQHLKILDLHSNQLSGSIPDFLGDLPALATLNLDNNNLSGEIPEKLRHKASNSVLSLSIAGNPALCSNQSNEGFCKTNITVIGKETSKKRNKAALIGGLAAAAGLVLIVVLTVSTTAFFFICTKGRKQPTPVDTQVNSQPVRTTHADESEFQDNVASVQEHIRNGAHQVQLFSYKDIISMTENLGNKIGQGAFGAVYYGLLKDRKPVAVKVLSKDSWQGEKQFQSEVELLSRTHHNNVVQLLGYCTERELILVYEYMVNGSLFDSLHGRGKSISLWQDRLQIAVDVARGLEYLHKHCSPPIIHRDVKSNNILLDEHMVAKISDFGISKSMEAENLQTAIVRGNYGYIDPEYLATKVVTYSIDVYAFGVVLLEILTGKPPIIKDTAEHDKSVYICQWARYHIDRGELAVILDPCLSVEMEKESLLKVVEIALSCVDRQGKKRPTMDEIKGELQKALQMEFSTKTTDAYYSEEMAIPMRVSHLNAR
ncbi:hypothetical protein KP509_22G044900 [Ceratopteris richardii]|uniref:non-specific serine/threonine protein kinase n=1 Tax=Ceratopteris richardii TaxID=49495 RepID=A0A8T2S4K0_CERRI|nr:hypothetical protein KP509_22G044900 [Ceratopteris richardii]